MRKYNYLCIYFVTIPPTKTGMSTAKAYPYKLEYTTQI